MAHSIVIIGVGPRGTYALDFLSRVLVAYPLGRRVDVHLVEPGEMGPGSVYRTTQPGYLLMNTVASQLSASADEPVGPGDPFAPGPCMYRWLRAEGESIGPDDYPSRAAHGRYLTATLERICRRELPGVTIRRWPCRAIDIQPVAGRQRVVLDNGQPSIDADVVLLNTGHSAHGCVLQDGLAAFAADQAARGNHRIGFHRSAYPVEQRIAPLGPQVRLGVLGLGLTAIDAIIAATEGKGGRFERLADGRLVYRRSGDEPSIVAWSLPGLPPSARAVNQKGATFRHPARLLTPARVDALRVAAMARTGTRQLDFDRDVFPLVLREMEHAYYAALRGPDFAARYLAAAADDDDDLARARLLAEIEPGLRFSWAHLADPFAGRSFASKAELTAFLVGHMRQELVEAARGNLDGPYKAATDVLRDLRGNLRYAVEYGGLTAESHRAFDTGFWPLHNRIVAGPPAIRVEQLLALMAAGVLDLSFGPAPRLTVDGERGCYRLTPVAFPGESVEIDVLIDGRVQMPNVRTDRSPLIRALLGRGLVRPFTNTTHGVDYTPCGIDITEDHRVIGADGAASDRLSAMGILCEGPQLYTFVAAAPGVAARPFTEARDWALRVRRQLAQAEDAAAAAARGPTPVVDVRGHAHG